MKIKLAKLPSIVLALSISSSVSAESIKFAKELNKASDTLVMFKSESTTANFSKVDGQTGGQLSRALKANQFDGSYGTFVEILAPNQMNYQLSKR